LQSIEDVVLELSNPLKLDLVAKIVVGTIVADCEIKTRRVSMNCKDCKRVLEPHDFWVRTDETIPSVELFYECTVCNKVFRTIVCAGEFIEYTDQDVSNNNSGGEK